MFNLIFEYEYNYYFNFTNYTFVSNISINRFFQVKTIFKLVSQSVYK